MFRKFVCSNSVFLRTSIRDFTVFDKGCILSLTREMASSWRAPSDQVTKYLAEWNKQGKDWPSDVNSMAIMLRDMEGPYNGKRHWHKDSRDHYNDGPRKITPMMYFPKNYVNGHDEDAWRIGGVPILWLGGQNGANDERVLHANNITARLFLKGTIGAKRTHGVHGMTPPTKSLRTP